MKSVKYYDDDKLVILGARFSSPRIVQEADRAAGLLSHYREILTAYGLDDRFAAQFDDLRKRHQELIAQRTQAIASKQNTIAHYNNTLHAAWTWVEQVHAILKPFARRNQNWSVRLNTVIPDTESELPSSIAQFRQLLEETKSQISSQVQVDELISASHEIEKQTHNVIGSKLQAKNQARDETRELDRLDGELILWIRDIYEVGRKAIRAGRIEAPLSEFRFHYCVHHAKPSSAFA